MMFGGLPPLPKPNWKPRPVPRIVDVPSAKPGIFGHVAREPNSDYRYKIMQYEQRKTEMEEHNKIKLNASLKKNAIEAKYMKHVEDKSIQRELKQRLDHKLEEYDRIVEEKRDRLRELFWREEREYAKETIDNAQKMNDLRLEESKQRLLELRAQREAERLEIVQQKKRQQYIDNCDARRFVISQLRRNETRDTQLIQMQEKQNKLQSEQELDHFWYQMMIKEIEAKIEREEHDAENKRKISLEVKDVLDQQTKEIEAKRQDRLREIQEERIEMDKVKEQHLKEQIAELDAKRRHRDKIYRELVTQMKLKEDVLAERQRQEKETQKVYDKIAEDEIRKEKEKVEGLTARLKKEMNQYMRYMSEMETERKEEEKKLNELIENAKEEIQRRQDDAKCRLHQAKMALRDEVMRGRAEQIDRKRKEAENQLEIRQTENELLRMAWDENERLKADYERRNLLTRKLYRDDLARQIVYRREVADRERRKIEEQLEEGKRQEEIYLRRIQEAVEIKEEVLNFSHPFKRAIDHHKSI